MKCAETVWCVELQVRESQWTKSRLRLLIFYIDLHLSNHTMTTHTSIMKQWDFNCFVIKLTFISYHSEIDINFTTTCMILLLNIWIHNAKMMYFVLYLVKLLPLISLFSWIINDTHFLRLLCVFIVHFHINWFNWNVSNAKEGLFIQWKLLFVRERFTLTRYFQDHLYYKLEVVVIMVTVHQEF